MPRPCHADHDPSPDTCRLCWLVANDPAHCPAEWLGGPAKRRADRTKPNVAKGAPG